MPDDHEFPGTGQRPPTIDTIIWQRISEIARGLEQLREILEEIRDSRFGPDKRELLDKLSTEWEKKKEIFDTLPAMVESYKRGKWVWGLIGQLILGAAVIVPAVIALHGPASRFFAKMFQ